MQHTKSFITTFILLSAFLSATAYAGKEFCPKDSVHCSYVTGLSDDLSDGRYIKLSNAYVSLVVCFNNYGLAFLPQDGAGKYVGTNTDQYSICTDESGKNCERVGVDSFVVSKNGNKYYAEPHYFAIDLSKVKNKYPTCDALGAKNNLKL